MCPLISQKCPNSDIVRSASPRYFSSSDIFKIRSNCCVVLSLVMGTVAGDDIEVDGSEQGVISMAPVPEPFDEVDSKGEAAYKNSRVLVKHDNRRDQPLFAPVYPTAMVKRKSKRSSATEEVKRDGESRKKEGQPRQRKRKEIERPLSEVNLYFWSLSIIHHFAGKLTSSFTIAGFWWKPADVSTIRRGGEQSVWRH